MKEKDDWSEIEHQVSSLSFWVKDGCYY